MGVLSTIRATLRSVFSPAWPVGNGGWMPLVVHEPYTGAWQHNDPLTVDSALMNPSVFGVVSRISQDIAKIAPPRLMKETENDIWIPVTNSAYSPVLERPNRYQNPQQFAEQWILSKTISGNTYALKDRDDRGVVRALYVLDPQRVKVLVAPDGSVYYELQPNELAGVPAVDAPIFPAREIIHDRWNCFHHPLGGQSPLLAVSGAIATAQAMQSSSTNFFAKGGRPGGVVTAPTKIDDAQKARIRETLDNFKSGGIMLLEYGLKYDNVQSSSAAETELIAQLGWTEEKICEVYGMPISILNTSKQPPYANAEASLLQYKSQCLEPHLRSMEWSLATGLELPAHLWIEFDIDRLIWMDTTTRSNAAKVAISAGALSPNEARATYYGVGPVAGGETPYLQQQNWPLSVLADRPAPAVPAAPDAAVSVSPDATPDDAAVAAGDPS